MSYKPEVQVNARAIKPLSAKACEIARRQRRRKATLLDPQYNNARRFPCFAPGMATNQYIAQYRNMNGYDKAQFGDARVSLAFLHADRAAPMLDPTEPEVIYHLEDPCCHTTGDGTVTYNEKRGEL